MHLAAPPFMHGYVIEVTCQLELIGTACLSLESAQYGAYDGLVKAARDGLAYGGQGVCGS